MEALAAYGGSVAPTIYRVKNLNDSGAGSLRSALEASGPRVVIFEVSGTIPLNSEIYVRNPYLTVAGQTAPSPGINLRNYGIVIFTHDILLQHLRIRHGGDTCGDGVDAWGDGVYNIVLDHLSASWGQDETIGISNPTRPANITVWRSIMSEGLYGALNGSGCSGSPDGRFSSHGLLVYVGTKNVSVLQSLFAHDLERNPYLAGDTATYVANNVIYDFDDTSATQLMGSSYPGGGVVRSTIVGNYYKRGPSTSTWVSAVGSRFLTGGSQLYLADNALDGGRAPFDVFMIIGLDGVDPRVGSPPVSVPGYSPISSSAAYGLVLAQAGARPGDRDAVDTRVVQEVQAGSGSYIRSPGEVGGWPFLPMNVRALDVPGNPHGLTSSGYTVLEEWLHGFAAAVEDGTDPGAGSAPPVTVPDPPSGLVASPNATRIPGVSSIVDNALAVWTLGPSREFLRNGVQAAGGSGFGILWYQGSIYVIGDDSRYWRWTGSTWAFASATDPSGGASADSGSSSGSSSASSGSTSTASSSGTRVPNLLSLLDSALNVWTLGPNSEVLRNGSQVVGGYASQILWFQNVIYVRGDDSNWWRFTGATWVYYGPSAPG